MQLELFQQGQQLEIVFPQGYYVHKEVIKTLEEEKRTPGATQREKKKEEERIEANKRAQIKG